MRFTTVISNVGRNIMFGISLVAIVSQATASPVFFTEDFSDNSPGPIMALGPAGGTPTTDFTGDFTVTSGAGSRIYLGTTGTDYLSSNFVFGATVTDPGTGSPWSLGFLGMGNYTPNPGTSYEPSSTMIVFGGRPDTLTVRVIDDNSGAAVEHSLGAFAASWAGGTHRLQMTWDASIQQALLQIDINYAGGPFVADFSTTVNGADNGFNATNSRLFVGGGFDVTFDDISVVPEPGSILLFGLGGAVALVRTRRRLVR